MRPTNFTTWIPVSFTIGVIIVTNVLIQPLILRFDLTKNKQYTLSKPTKEILRNLSEQVTITAYFSEDLPPDIGKVRRDFQDLLVELSSLANGKIDFTFVSPQTDAIKQEAAQLGIQHLKINVREKDQIKQQQAFMGAIIRKGAVTEVIPFVQPGVNMEYNLIAAIKKLSIETKPRIAFLQGHGESSLNEMAQVINSLSQLYEIEQLDLNMGTMNPDSIKVAVLNGPKSLFIPAHFQQMDDFLNSGGSILLAFNRLEIDMQSGTAYPSQTGLEYWLDSKGLKVDTALVLDIQCGSVSVPQYIGSIQINTQVQFPYLPLAVTFADHPTVKGMQQVLFPYVSPLVFTKIQQNSSFYPLIFSSDKSGLAYSPITLKVGDKNWTQSDFPLSNQVLAGLWEQENPDGSTGRIILLGDADFALSDDQGKGVSPANTTLMVNLVDWLADDAGLMNLRNKETAVRPIEAKYLLEETSKTRELIKWGNVLTPVFILILIGILLIRKNKRLIKSRMTESYS